MATRSMSRRDAIRLLGAAGLALGGCAEELEESDGQAGAASARCGSAATGTAPEELRRYENIVVLMMENRSFDHYFGHLSLPRELGGEGRTDVDGFKGGESQLGLDGTAFRPWMPETYELADIGHGWDDCHGQFNGGRMDGFIRMHAENLAREQADARRTADPMAYYTRKDTPVFHQLLDEYALCDRWFSSVMGPTWPNRFYLHAATAGGTKGNTKLDIEKRPKTPDQARTIWHELDDKCITAVNYGGDVQFVLGGFGPFNNAVRTNPVFGASRNTVGPRNSPVPPTTMTATFEEACERGILPTVSVIDPAFFLAPCDDHPPHDIQAGQAFVAAIYKLLTKNEKQWKKTLFIITYDEHGSFYDHVKPPTVADDERAEFRQLGFRVPALVIGPYVKKRHVSHVQYDHVSFLSTVTRRFDLEPLNARVKNANDVRDCIDRDALETTRGPASPVQLRSVTLSESRVHDSIADSLGQSELALVTRGGPATREQKRRATDELLGVFDRLGVADVKV